LEPGFAGGLTSAVRVRVQNTGTKPEQPILEGRNAQKPITPNDALRKSQGPRHDFAFNRQIANRSD
jgi:hypothetical protein